MLHSKGQLLLSPEPAPVKYALGPACVAGAGVVSGWVMGAAVVVGTGGVGADVVSGWVMGAAVVVGTGVVVANLVVVGAATPTQDVPDFV